MRAVVITKHGGHEVLQVQEMPDPPVGAGEVRIAVKAAGINFADTVARVGLYPVLDALGPTSARKGYRILRAGGCLILYGASEVSTGEKRNLVAAGRAALKAPFATLPWWKSIGVMNENKGMFGLNMLHWWDQEGSLDRVLQPLLPQLEKGDLQPVVAEAFPFEQAPDAHRFIAERRNIGKVVLVP